MTQQAQRAGSLSEVESSVSEPTGGPGSHSQGRPSDHPASLSSRGTRELQCLSSVYQTVTAT